MKLSCIHPEVDIRLKNGVYVFLCDSSTGKTYLASILKKMEYVDNVISFSYSDSEANLITMNRCIGKSVVMFDRYDLYAGKYIDIINKIKDSSIVLMDYKFTSNFNLCMKDCIIELESNSIEVFE